MKSTSFVVALAVAAALSAPAARNAQAANAGIQKCRAADGTVVYTDTACATFDAAPAAISNELGMRLANERTRAMAQGSSLSGASLPSFSGSRAGTAAVGRRALAAGCARSPTQLAMDVQASTGLGDVNRLAESYHWVGMKHAEALPVMQRLERMARSRVVSAQVYSGGMGLQFADASGDLPAPAAATLMLTVQDDGATRPLELNVEQYGGCYFMRF